MLSCEICEIFKNSYLDEHLRITAFFAMITMFILTNMK